MLLAVVGDNVALGAGGLLVLGIAGYLFKELRRKDDGVWAIIAEKDRVITDLESDRDKWMKLYLDLLQKRGGR